MRKAIVENGVVTNVIEYTGGRMHLQEGQIMADCERYPVAIGDDFADWKFYRDGARLLPEPTDAERLAAVTAELVQTQLATAELAGLIASLMAGGGQ